MSAYQSEALTLRSYSYSEGHKIAVFLTREFGQLRAAAYGAEKPGSRFGSALEPLTYSRVTFSRREHQDLAVLQSCEIIHALPAHLLSWEWHLYLGYFSELVVEFSQELEENEMLFRLSLAVVESVSKVPPDILARYFELWLLKLEGILPRLSGKLPSVVAAKAEAMMKLPPGRLGDFELSAEESKRLGGLSSELIEYHLEKRLKTRRLLSQLS